MTAKIINRFLYPCILIGNFSVYYMLHTSFNLYLLVPVVLLVSFVVVRLCELIVPKVVEWNDVSRDLTTDLLHTVFTKIGAKEFIKLVLYSFLLKLQSIIVSFFNISEFIYQDYLLLKLLVAILIAEFLAYWIHRMSHRIKNLWLFHSIHHSSQRMWILNVSRAHPLDIIIRLFFPFAIIIVLGFDTSVLGAYLVISSSVAFLQHSNLELETKFLNYFLVTPSIHHWHHSLSRADDSCNYGHVLIIYDRLFGTFYLPKEEEVECREVGVIDSDVPSSFLGQLKYPFDKWRQ